jgi:hypothetical protein
MKRIAAITSVLLFVFACKTAQQPPKTSGGTLPMTGSATVSGVATASYAALPEPPPVSADQYTKIAAAVAEFAMLLRKSPHKGSATFADALALARAWRGVDLDGTREEMLRMLDSARAMSGESGTIARK